MLWRRFYGIYGIYHQTPDDIDISDDTSVPPIKHPATSLDSSVPASQPLNE